MPLAPETVRRLDTYAESTLRCPPSLARRGGLRVLPDQSRALPSWGGFAIPILALNFREGAVVSVRPDLQAALRDQLGPTTLLAEYLDDAAMRRLHRALYRLCPNAFVLTGDLRAVDRESFRPTATVERADLIPRNDPAAMHLRHRFDGEVFGVRGPRGRLMSWAALKMKSDDVWEVAVATEPEYRGRGYARDVVAAASAHTLNSGRLCVYIHDQDNRTSAFVCRALGYGLYSGIALAEY